MATAAYNYATSENFTSKHLLSGFISDMKMTFFGMSYARPGLPRWR